MTIEDLLLSHHPVQQFSQNAISSEIGADSSDIGFLSTLSPRHLHPSCGAIFTNSVHLSSHSKNSIGEGPVSSFPADTCASPHPQEFSHFLDYLERIARMSGVGVGLPGSEEPAFAGDDR